MLHRVPLRCGSRGYSTHTFVGGPKTISLHPDRATIRASALRELGLEHHNAGTWPPVAAENKSAQIPRFDPTTREPIASIQDASWPQISELVDRCQAAQRRWCKLPGDRRVDIVLEMNEALKNKQEALANLLTLEVGKVPSESRGELVENYDVAAVIQARRAEVGGSQPYVTRRYDSSDPERRKLGWYGEERQLPLGILGKVTAFNFPYAVFGWGALPALAAGNAAILKPHPDASLTSLAMIRTLSGVAAKHGLEGLVSLAVTSDWETTQALWKDMRIPMWEVTGSEEMGKAVAQHVGPSFRRVTYELGGNNALIVHKDANLHNALQSAIFGCTGTAGQRCTTTRVVYVHQDHYDAFVQGLAEGYRKHVRIGDPLQPGVNMGPVFHQRAVQLFERSVAEYKKHGSALVIGGNQIHGNFVEPTVFLSPSIDYKGTLEERFTPIVHVVKYGDNELAKVIDTINNTGYGLSCGIFTKSSDVFRQFVENVRVGILNMNYGTSGAEAGENFGGEGKTGNGRMMGPRIFQHYMRPINSIISPFESRVVHAQGVSMD